jgi:hypothetical protein
MQAKALELRDEATFIPVLAVDMNPYESTVAPLPERSEAQRYLLRRCGYTCDGRPNVIMTRLDGNGKATNDPYAWNSFAHTFAVAHNYIIDHWDDLRDGDVVDVEFILGKRTMPKTSERITSPID